MENEIVPGIPHDDLQLNVFLLDLADELTNEDFERIKFLCSGDGGIPKGLLEKIQSPLEFFQYCKHNCCLSRYNLIELQSWLWHVKRKDLFKKVTEFAQGLDNVLHLFAPKPEPENGFKYIKFHVGGKPENYTRTNLETIRNMVSQWMCVPEKYVYIAGIEPSESIVVTFMVPDLCLEFMTELEAGAQHILKTMHVDVMDLDGKIITVTEAVASPESVLTKELKVMQAKNKHLAKLNEDLNMQMLILRRENESTPRTEQAVNSILPFLMNVVYELHRLQVHPASYVRPRNSEESIRKENARKYYFTMLAKVKNEIDSLDLDLIYNLIEAHTMVIMDTFRDQQLVNIKTLDFLVQDLLLKMTILSRKNQELLLRLQVIDLPKALDVQLCEINVGIRHEFAKALAKVSKELRPKDREKLLKEVDWNAEEKEFLTKNHDKCLLMILCKNISETGDAMHSVTMLHQKLESIDRKDLVPKIEEYTEEYTDNVYAQATAQNIGTAQQIKLQTHVESLPKEKKRHGSGEESTKVKHEYQTEDLSQTNSFESLLRETNKMLKSLTEKQARWSLYSDLLPSQGDQPPYSGIHVC